MVQIFFFRDTHKVFMLYLCPVIFYESLYFDIFYVQHMYYGGWTQRRMPILHPLSKNEV